MSIEALRAAIAAGPTPGPWNAQIPSAELNFWARDAYIRAESWGYIARIGIDPSLPQWDGPQRANAAYIAAACNAAPTLLAQRDELLAAIKAAREVIAQDRASVMDCHQSPVTGAVEDEHGLAAIAEYDAALSKIDAAITNATGEQS